MKAKFICLTLILFLACTADAFAALDCSSWLGTWYVQLNDGTTTVWEIDEVGTPSFPLDCKVIGTSTPEQGEPFPFQVLIISFEKTKFLYTEEMVITQSSLTQEITLNEAKDVFEAATSGDYLDYPLISYGIRTSSGNSTTSSSSSSSTSSSSTSSSSTTTVSGIKPSLTVDPKSGQAWVTDFTFTAQPSVLAGSVTEYWWDFDGDGAALQWYEGAGIDYITETNKVSDVEYYYAGTYTAYVIMFDDDDNYEIASTIVIVGDDSTTTTTISNVCLPDGHPDYSVECYDEYFDYYWCCPPSHPICYVDYEEQKVYCSTDNSTNTITTSSGSTSTIPPGLDDDNDGILSDGDLSGIIGDNLCKGSNTNSCDDNCRFKQNPDQKDSDNDSTGDVCDIDLDNDGIMNQKDNCQYIPNGPLKGTCIWGPKKGAFCTVSGYDPMECGEDGFCSMNQEDTIAPAGNGIGDACESTTSTSSTTTIGRTGGSGGGGGSRPTTSTTSSLVTTSSSSTTTIPTPLPECESASDCDDKVFCNGQEQCGDGKCIVAVSPCNHDQLCMEVMQECWDIKVLTAQSLQTVMMRPFFLAQRCPWLILQVTDDNHFDQSSTITLGGSSDDATGVLVDNNRTAIKFWQFILIPICIDKDSTVGLWRVSIETDVQDSAGSFKETIEASFEVR